MNLLEAIAKKDEEEDELDEVHITLIGRSQDDPLFHNGMPLGNLSCHFELSDRYRRIDIVGKVLTYCIDTVKMDEILVLPCFPLPIVKNLFHYCGNELYMGVVKGDEPWTRGERYFFSCKQCDETMVLPVKEQFGSESRHILGVISRLEFVVCAMSSGSIYSNADFGKLPDQIRKLSKDTINKLYRTNQSSSSSLEVILEKLFPNVPASVMEQLLREIVGKTDATISSLEKEVALDSWGYSLSEAVGRFTFARNGQGYVIKVMKDRAVAEKEILVAKTAFSIPKLALYVPRMFVDEPLSYKGYHLIIMDDVSSYSLPHDIDKINAYRSAGETKKRLSNQLVHRLYVASLFHTYLAPLAENPLFGSCSVQQYYSKRDLEDILGEAIGIRQARSFLQKEHDLLVSFLKDVADHQNILVHNDMRDVNWAGQQKHITIDFGTVSKADAGGGIYRDIARILIAENSVKLTQREYIERVIACYYSFRRHEQNEIEHEMRGVSFMRQECTKLYAAIAVEATRMLRTVCKTMAKESWERVLMKYATIAQLATKETLKLI